MEAFLISRKEAVKRYGICMRELEHIYQRDRTFPVVRNGKHVLIIRDEADEYFRSYKGGNLK